MQDYSVQKQIPTLGEDLCNRVPCIAALGIVQQAPVPKKKHEDNQRRKKIVIANGTQRRINETYSAIGFNSLQVLSTRK